MKKFESSTLAGATCIILSLFLVACGGGGGGDAATAAAQDPANPVNPVDPGNPGNPGNPVDPVDPVDPGVIVVSNLAPSNYNVNSLGAGSKVYIDRDYTFINVPVGLGSLDYIQTANGDKNMNDAASISFNVNGAVTVYVGFDISVSASDLPAWLQTWTDSGAEVQASHTEFLVYEKDFPAGQVVLGGNEVGFSMYTVLVTSQGGSGSGGGTGGGAAPTIGGTPSSSISQDVTYSFAPTASDPEGDDLTFSIANKPDWAGFDTRTGVLSGTPGAGDVGDHPGIRVTVTDSVSEASLPAFTITVVGTATGSAMLSWTAPTQNEDGSTLDDLAGYRIHYGTSPGNYPNKVNIGSGVTSYMVENLTPQTWYFVVTAFDTSLNHSEFSNTGSKTVTP